MNKDLMTLKIAGMKFHEGVDIIEDVHDDEELTLILEPDNKFDRFAVKVMIEGTMLGYVPATHSKIISTLIENNIKLEAFTTEVNPFNPPHEMVKFTISLAEV